MAKSRYDDTPVIDDHHYGTFSLPVYSKGYKILNLLEGVRTIDHVFVRGERLDHLAARYFNTDEYWWVIALVNDISYPFASGGLTPGKTLKIPVDIKDVLDKIFT